MKSPHYKTGRESKKKSRQGSLEVQRRENLLPADMTYGEKGLRAQAGWNRCSPTGAQDSLPREMGQYNSLESGL